jgi:hypothetical protein
MPGRGGQPFSLKLQFAAAGDLDVAKRVVEAAIAVSSRQIAANNGVEGDAGPSSRETAVGQQGDHR